MTTSKTTPKAKSMKKDFIQIRLILKSPLVALTSVALLGGCVFRPEPEPNRWGYGGTEYFTGSSTSAQTPPPPSGPPQGPPDIATNSAGLSGSATSQPTVPLGQVAQSAIPWGIPVEGKPGFIRSPYSPGGGQIDARGLPPGTEIKDPYNPGKLLLVP